VGGRVAEAHQPRLGVGQTQPARATTRASRRGSARPTAPP
jgi:hypothetical protein